MGSLLVLGCNGYARTKEFILCNGVYNAILNTNNLTLEQKNKVMDFVATSGLLENSIIEDKNLCANIVGYMHRELDVLDSDTLLRVQEFMAMHKPCGLYLILIDSEEYRNV